MTHRRGNEISIVLRTTGEEALAYQQAANEQCVSTSEWIREACAVQLATLESEDPVTRALRTLRTHWRDTASRSRVAPEYAALKGSAIWSRRTVAAPYREDWGLCAWILEPTGDAGDARWRAEVVGAIHRLQSKGPCDVHLYPLVAAHNLVGCLGLPADTWRTLELQNLLLPSPVFGGNTGYAISHDVIQQNHVRTGLAH